MTEKKLNFDISSSMERLTEGEGQYNWRHDTQHNGTQHNDTQHTILKNAALNVMALNIECHFVDCQL